MKMMINKAKLKKSKLKKKSISPLISVILLVVISVILVSIILSFGKSFTNQGLDKTKDIKELSKSDAEHFIYPKTFSDGVIQFSYSPPNNFGDINITKYKIFYDNNETTEIVLDTPHTLKAGTNILPLDDFSDQNVTTKKFTLILETEDNKYVTLKNITNPYPYVEPEPEPYVPQAYVVGPLSPGTATNDASIGVKAWLNPNNIMLQDTIGSSLNSTGNPDCIVGYCSNNCLTTPITSNYLKATNFGFNIPIGATIDGIIIEIDNRATWGVGNDNEVKIVKSGSIGTINKANEIWWKYGFGEYIVYGNSSDLWNETWTAEDINDPNFGVAISAVYTDGGDCGFAAIDHIRITVHYSN